MDETTATAVLQGIKEVGFPIAACCGLGAAIWRVVVWIGSRADKIIDRSIAGLDAVAASMGVQTEILKSMQAEQSEHGALLLEIVKNHQGCEHARLPQVMENHNGGRCPSGGCDLPPIVTVAR